MWLRVSVVWLVLVAAAVPARAGDGDPSLLVLGDSLSAAYGLPVEAGWVALLRERLDAEGCPHRVVNASVSGETSRGGRSRLPELLRAHDPELVILELGGNDGLRGLDLGQLRANLAAMIEAVKASGARVLLVGMRMPPNYGPAYTERFAGIYRDLAGEYGVERVPFLLEGVGGVDALMQPDGVHANAAAQPRLLDNVWAVLEGMLGACAADGP